jgi:hypothetical protein
MVSRVQILLIDDHIAWIADLWNEQQDNQTPCRFTLKKGSKIIEIVSTRKKKSKVVH